MLECDFNARMPGVGPARAARLLADAMQHAPRARRLIEVAAARAPELPWELLNAERCREIFLSTEACARALSALGEADLSIDSDAARASECAAEFAAWRRICGPSGARNVAIRPAAQFSPDA